MKDIVYCHQKKTIITIKITYLAEFVILKGINKFNLVSFTSVLTLLQQNYYLTNIMCMTGLKDYQHDQWKLNRIERHGIAKLHSQYNSST